MLRFLHTLGNDDAKARLSAAFDAGRASHALLLCGPLGSGRRTLALDLASALLCSGDSRRAPCGVCRQCVQLSSGGHPDLTLTEGSGATDMVGVDAVRALRMDAHVLPVEAEKKVFIIAGSGMTPAAQNALLKVLEEPPVHAVFILLALGAQSVLPTVRSRCVKLTLRPLDDDVLLPALRERMPGADESSISRAARLSGGIMGRALDFLSDKTFNEAVTLSAQYATALAGGELYAVLASGRRLGTSRDRLALALEFVTLCLRDALMAKCGVDAAPLSDPDIPRGIAPLLTKGAIVNIIEHVQDTRVSISSNVTPQLLAAALSLRCFEERKQF